ncbi:MAG: LpxD N-terminal domain-containing protein, partial [Steroidobacteraceae bacterium]
MELRGSPDIRVSRVATLSHAVPGTLSFLANSRYRRNLPATHASAVVLAPADADACPVAALIGPNPYLSYAHIATLLHPASKAVAGIHATAVVSPRARVAASAVVGPLAVIEDQAEIGEHAE